MLGLAKSGVAAAEILHELGAFVTVNDSKPFDESPDAQGLLQKGLQLSVVAILKIYLMKALS